MAERAKGAGYEAWFDKIKAKYPDARARTTGANGWSTLGFDGDTPTLSAHMSGPHYTDVSSPSYSERRLVGAFDHNTHAL